jgi:hypothetical protein
MLSLTTFIIIFYVRIDSPYLNSPHCAQYHETCNTYFETHLVIVIVPPHNVISLEFKCISRLDIRFYLVIAVQAEPIKMGTQLHSSIPCNDSGRICKCVTADMTFLERSLRKVVQNFFAASPFLAAYTRRG